MLFKKSFFRCMYYCFAYSTSHGCLVQHGFLLRTHEWSIRSDMLLSSRHCTSRSHHHYGETSMEFQLLASLNRATNWSFTNIVGLVKCYCYLKLKDFNISKHPILLFLIAWKRWTKSIMPFNKNLWKVRDLVAAKMVYSLRQKSLECYNW